MRKPASLHFAGGKGPRQRVWEMIRAFAGKRFEVIDVIPRDVSPITAQKYVKSLLAACLVVAAEDRPGVRANRPHKGYRLVKDVGVEAPRLRIDGTPVTRGRAQENMWRTLRMHSEDISATQLAAHASTPALPVPVVSARSYLGHLHAAKYVVLIAKRSGTRDQHYRLIKNSGPRAPMVSVAQVLYDPNTDTATPLTRVSEEDFIYGK